jgi:hypothetical protein
MKILRVRLPDSVFEIPLVEPARMTAEQQAAISLRDFWLIITAIEKCSDKYRGASANLEIINGGPEL